MAEKGMEAVRLSGQLHARILRAYDIIGEATPVSADCGQLCGAACCQGDDYGMLLFPGEAVHLARVPGFQVSRIKYMDGRAWLLSCGGTCERSLRPLSCRIFPLAPHVGQNGVTALPDPRALRMCPLAEGKYLDRGFRRSVGKAFSYLAKDPKMLRFMKMISAELDELRVLL